MIDLKQYGYIEAETPPIGFIPGRVTELQRDQYTVITTLETEDTRNEQP
ncbi:hypothetical protein [Paenibacillus arenosi]|uniref:Uncharacterized protein n=1 Tax=Paenibacillus arenosi TaxID=2774142 RepID=A0ABR9B3M6_9BACL|nr:hypothetical protein [Paenibacillus arenosi]MBD8500956.1 hypothetical protein [Paenibacillus arenosi]